MAIIPGGQQIRTTSADVDLTPRGNALVKKQNKVYTMDDIVETVNAEGGSLPYSSLHLKITQVGSATPTLNVLHNDTDITFASVFYSTGIISLNMTSGTYPDVGEISVLCGGFSSGHGTKTFAFGSHGANSGQTITINTGYFDGSNDFINSDIGFGGTNSMIVEIRVYS